jgi:hypothetical protein
MFPKTIIGACEECGMDGHDEVTANLTSADAEERDTAGEGLGVELWEYQGRMLCNVCIERLKSDDVSREDALKHAEEQKFRTQAGFVNSI